MKLYSLIFALLLVSCASKQILLEDGKSAYFVECKKSMEKCYKVATRTCPMGYDVIGKEEDQAPASLTHWGKRRRIEMTYRCRANAEEKTAEIAPISQAR